MSKTALVFLAAGAEEMEFVIVADVLRRCGVNLMIFFFIQTENFKNNFYAIHF